MMFRRVDVVVVSDRSGSRAGDAMGWLRASGGRCGIGGALKSETTQPG